MTEVEAQKAVTMLITAFPQAMARLTPDQQANTRAVYRSMLLDLDSAAAAGAIERLITSHRYPTLPTIAEIRSAALETKHGQVRSGLDAWGDVKAAVAAGGRRGAPKIADPLAAHAIGRLGWDAFCDSDVGDEPSWRARFAELYDRLAGERRLELLVRDLPATRRLRESGKAVPLSGLLAEFVEVER